MNNATAEFYSLSRQVVFYGIDNKHMNVARKLIWRGVQISGEAFRDVRLLHSVKLGTYIVLYFLAISLQYD